MPIYKDKNKGTYYVKLRINGKSTTKRGFNTKAEAEKYEMRIKLYDSGAMDYKFQFIANEYLNYAKNNSEYGTYMKSKNLIETYILPNVANKYMSKIDEKDCLKFRETIQNLELSTLYKNDILIRYKSIFRYAAKYFRLNRNPSLCIDQFKLTRDEKIESREREYNVWTNEDFEKFIKHVNKTPYKEMFTLLFYTGMRIGECLALTWKDFNGNSISINKSLTRKCRSGSYEIKEPKTQSSIRTISLNESLVQYLNRYKEKEIKNPGFNEEWFMFGRLNPLPQTTIDRIKEKAILDSGVRRIRIHDFRHSHASNLISNGVNIVAVSKRLGHSSVNMTLEKYTHLMQKSDDELIQNLEKCSQNVLNNNTNN